MLKTDLKYNKPLNSKILKEYMDLPLEDKILISINIIKEFVEFNGEDTCIISSSFGKDSIVIIDLVRKIYPEMPIVFFNSGVEHPAAVELSKKYDNVFEVFPKKRMEDVIEEFGYILPIGKEQTRCLRLARENIYSEKWNTGCLQKLRGEWRSKLHDYRRHVYCLVAPFKIGARCDYHLKEYPQKHFAKTTQYKNNIIGITAEESRTRRQSIISKGFNTDHLCRCIGHWKKQDVLQYIVNNGLEIPSSYGKIIKEKGKLKTTRHQRTGCVCCPIGTINSYPNQVQLHYIYDRDIWDYVINDLGFKQVYEFFKIPYTVSDEEMKKIIEKENKKKELRL